MAIGEGSIERKVHRPSLNQTHCIKVALRCSSLTVRNNYSCESQPLDGIEPMRSGV